ncbi:hypothetical protein HXX76_006294 [Chlamydomonas incerta]|uniref:Uncharacterized protein n=1 Tax=Chlamydomonas incerta TaxID=51695 RepID=A0A835TDE4_CHLIN|nr:hypothetical protein HXX76_006294 [Chlamydomonas incerta]|eukprot:KAG2436770.1 hypothetical protein HXX76_006294 [Chlamydomonas incerta]
MLFMQFAAALAMYIIAQQRLVNVDVVYIAPPPPPGRRPPRPPSAPPSPGPATSTPSPPLSGGAARHLLQQFGQQPHPALPPSLSPPPPAPAPNTNATAGEHWACLLETNPADTGACGGITVLWWWSFAMVVPLCLGPIITTVTSGSPDSAASTLGCLISGPVFISMLSLTVVYGITGQELDRTARAADAAGLPGGGARRQVVACAWVALAGGVVDAASSLWCTWTGLRTGKALAPLLGLLFPLYVLAWPLRVAWRRVREPVCREVRQCCVFCLAAASCLPLRDVERLAAAAQAGRSGGAAELVVVDGREVCFGEWDGYVRGRCPSSSSSYGGGGGGGGGEPDGGRGAAGPPTAPAGVAVEGQVGLEMALGRGDAGVVKVEVGEQEQAPARRPGRGRLRGRGDDTAGDTDEPVPVAVVAGAWSGRLGGGGSSAEGQGGDLAHNW